ncbi:hypothetical protein J2128_001528 [Methanomicrobium sp. W14]|uniref:SAM-dependent methyltransferase HcgC family protein n=1 Tax=Methanomicrobium sp. W14 TaxID=2817839 RepID=UPI001AE35801|nr:SAM-dependent methyltransferase HcgC family protein [Methanomicrobium sp. W14]MBP2133574.1 hypothetical protein [Methanomicrobium sp. W14]
MTDSITCETGITPTVMTFFSDCTVYDLIDAVAGVKVLSVLEWMMKKRISPGKCLIMGSYLTGAKLADCLSEKSRVTVVDINPQTHFLLGDRVRVAGCIEEVSDERWDMIVDTTGFGGTDPKSLLKLRTPDVFIVENPCSDGSGDALKKINHSRKLLETMNAPAGGLLHSGGLNSKTSGTMTIAIEILRRSMEDALSMDGVLYAAASMEFYERILFKEKNPEKFVKSLKKNAFTVSSVNSVDCNDIITNNLGRLKSEVIDFGGGKNKGVLSF